MAKEVMKFPTATPVLVAELSDIPAPPDLSTYFPYNQTAAVGFIENGNTLELWWNGKLVESWTVTPVTPPAGTPLGLLLI